MSGFMDQCLEVYCNNFTVDEQELTKKSVSTPFLDGTKVYVVKCQGHCDRCGALCCSGNLSDLRPKEKEKKGAPKEAPVLFRPAARVLMKVLYTAR